MSIQEILKDIQKFNCKTVEVTGGEPLLQEEVSELMDTLIEAGYTVLLETSGAISIAKVNKKVIKIIDLKTPSSQMTSHNLWENLSNLNTHDEIKFVIGDRQDYEWAKSVITQYGLLNRCHCILMSPTHRLLQPGKLGKWIVDDNLPVRLQVQLHKYLEMR